MSDPVADDGTSAAGDPSAGVSRVEVANQAWALDRRRQVRFAGFLVGVLALLTAYAVALNVAVLYQSVPSPYTLDLESGLVPDAAASYSASVRWRVPADAPGVSHPAVFLGNRAIPVGSGFQAAGVPVEGHALSIRPESASSGTHEGDLVFTRRGSNKELPEEVTLPIRVRVTSGFWSSWFVVRDWLILASLVCACVYLFCVVVFPAPSGELHVLVSSAGHTRHCRLPLQRPRLAWLLPWRRSTLSLSRLLRDARSPVLARGEIQFVSSTLPVLWLGGASDSTVKRRKVDTEPLEQSLYAQFAPFGRFDTMSAGKIYRISDLTEDDCALLQFVRRPSVES